MAEILFDAPVPPDTLTRYIEKYVPRPAENQLTSLVNVNYVADDKVRWGTITRKNRMAKYRAFDGNIARAQRDSAAEQWVPLAPFSNSQVTGEYETLQKEFARMQGGNKAVLADAIYNDADALTISMWNRVEKALGSTAATGKFTVNENRTMYEADYAIPAGNKITAATPWSNAATAQAADDLRNLRSAYLASAGVAPGRIITSELVISSLLRNAQIVAEALGTTSGRTRITRAELNAWLASENLPSLVTEVEGVMYNDETGNDERVLPQDLLIMTPANLGDALEFTFGLSASALKLVNSNRTDLTFGDRTRITGMVIEDGPPFREFVYVDAVGIPVLTAPQRIVVADVL